MKKYLSIKTWIGISILLGLLFSACSQSHETSSTMDGELRIVATTTFIGDVVGVITGDAAAVITLLEPGQNPHSYQPRPMDMVNISEADVIFVNGLGLEEFLDDLLDGSDTNAEVIVVSEGITPLKIGENLGVSQDDDHQIHSGEDPHVWFDPNNIMIWTENISRVLGRIDSPNAESYQANAETYRNELLELDTWIREQIELIPPENRELVTDHTLLGYFAEEYDFTQIGAVIPAMTTEAETSGQQLAELIDIIREHQTRAIFVGVDFDPTLIQRVADETGVDLISLYFGSLTAGSPADTYLTFMQYNVEAIVSALQ